MLDGSLEVSGTPLKLAGEDFVADPTGVLLWPSERMLIAADLHLEKGSSYARRGVFLPPYDSIATLTRLEIAASRHRPATILALGDSFHERGAEERLPKRASEMLRSLMTGRNFIWVTGNHDPAPDIAGGDVASEIVIGKITLRHEPQSNAAGEIAGHLHPVANVRAKGRRIRRRCFAAAGERIVLPALGAYAGGLCVLNEAFRALIGRDFLAVMLGTDRSFAIPSAGLSPDAA